MGEVAAKRDRVTQHEFRHDTVSLLTDHLVFSPKYRGKVLEGEVAEAAEDIIRNLSLEKKALPKKQGKRCGKELDIEVIDLSVNVDHVHLFIKYPPKYSVSWIAKRIKGRSSKLLRDRFPYLKEWCPDHLWAPSCYHKTFKKSFIKNASQSVGHGWEVVERYISWQKGSCCEKTDAMRVRGEKGKKRGARYSYEKKDTVPIVVTEEGKEKTHKIGCKTLYTKLFKGYASQE